MKIKIIEIEKSRNFDACFQADCEDCPGMPPVGYGKTKEEAMAALFYQLMFGNTGGPDPVSWLSFIKLEDPIVINEKMWENPIKNM